MLNFRKLLCRPQVDDWSPLAKFFFADEALNAVAAELDAFDNRRHPERCQQLVAKLRSCQDRVLQIIEEMLSDLFPDPRERAPRDYRVKFPDDVLHDSFSGQLWFAAECLAAGSNIVDRDFESEALRPLAKSLSRHVDELRDMLKLQSLKNPAVYPEKLKNSLLVFDHLFAEFELNYVSTMVPVKTAREYELQQEMVVLFSETLIRAKKKGLITEEQVETCDPTIMFSLPRLAIVCGLVVYPDGPLNMDRSQENVCEMLRPFRRLLEKIKLLLLTLDDGEMSALESKLSSTLESDFGPDEVSLFSDFCLRRKAAELAPSSSPDCSGFVDPTKPCVSQYCKQDCSENGCPEIGAVERAEEAYSRVENGDTSTPALRIRYRSSSDLIHRLFVCIAGIADQWQSTYPSDLRVVLKTIFHPGVDDEDQSTKVFEEEGQVASRPGNPEETGIDAAEPSDLQHVHVVSWVPDEECDCCSFCQVRFSFVRRRHHCRCCGNIFCGRCTTNFVPLPSLGYSKPVRVCDQCFEFLSTDTVN
uniref:FYVE-type domain-containing protein n=1 Tax=Trichuris muris TaxID=70415 RepID=A0A5S6QPQ8_TRIMR